MLVFEVHSLRQWVFFSSPSPVVVVEHSHLLLFLSTTRAKPSRLHSTRTRRLTVLRNIRALPLRRQFILESLLRPTRVGGRERTAPTDVELTVVLVYRNRVLSEASTGLFEAALRKYINI